MRLKDKIALITGSSRGIGKSIALQYAAEGAKVIVSATTLESAEKVANEIKRSGGEAFATAVDIANRDNVLAMYERIFNKYDHLDIVVNNAGISMTKSTIELTENDWDRTLDINLKGTFFSCQIVAKKMFAQREGCIINISSIWGSAAAPERAAYCASKWGVEGLSKVLAIEWASKGIRVNCIAPGYTYTDQIKELIERGIVKEGVFKKRIPLQRFASVKDIGNAAIFLASDEASYINGEVIRVDGGFNAFGYLIE
jgi:3-oxoacyl-[acyl-carrier protein] reductase